MKASLIFLVLLLEFSWGRISGINSRVRRLAFRKPKPTAFQVTRFLARKAFPYLWLMSVQVNFEVPSLIIPYPPLFSRDLNFAKIFSAHFSSL